MDAPALPQVSEYDEVVLYITPRAIPTDTPPTGAPTQETAYDGWFYSKLKLALPRIEGGALRSASPPPSEIGGLPLVSHIEITLRRRPYSEYLSALSAGEEGVQTLQTILFDSFPPASPSPLLARLLEALPAGSRLRIWWMADAPELDDVPWESARLGKQRPPRLSIVRGRPRASTPPKLLPAERPLTIAVFDPAERAPDPIDEAFAQLSPAVEIVRLDAKDPRDAISEAARAGFEGIHLIADASVPFGIDGLLEFPGGATISPGEVTHLLRASRVAILSLSAPTELHLGPDRMPTAFHGFARFGRAIGDGLSVVTPLGPIAALELGSFWRTFYSRFGETLDVEDALATANPCPLRVPVVLFLGHRLGRQFVRETDDDPVSFDPNAPSSPTEASEDLAISGGLLDAAMRLQRQYAKLGQHFAGKGLIDEQRVRLRALASYVHDALSRRPDR